MISDYGIMLDDGLSKFTVVTSTGGATGKPFSADRTHFTVILSEGRNRQIRRTFAALGYRVTALHRTQFGPYQLAGLASGKCEVVTRV